MHELTQKFMFEAAHTLQREIESDSSRRVHGHTYFADVTVAGKPDAATGMVMDLAVLRSGIEEIRERLDHRLLDEVPGLGPPTLESLCSFIAWQMRTKTSKLVAVRVWREGSGDSCQLRVAASNLREASHHANLEVVE